LIINGKRELLFSGSVHYPRSTPHVSTSTLFLLLPNQKDDFTSWIGFWFCCRCGPVSLTKLELGDLTPSKLMFSGMSMSLNKARYHRLQFSLKIIPSFFFLGDLIICLKMVQYDFKGRFDLVKFIKLIHEKGLYVTLRLGPFIQAEWNHGYEIFKP